MLCPRERHFIRCLVTVQPRKTGIRPAMTTLVDCDTKHQHKQTKQMDVNQAFAHTDRHKPKLHSQVSC